MDTSKMKIRILKNGPYLVSGSVPLLEKIITPDGRGGYKWQDGRVLPQGESSMPFAAAELHGMPLFVTECMLSPALIWKKSPIRSCFRIVPQF